jgi:hypothetical protein
LEFGGHQSKFALGMIRVVGRNWQGAGTLWEACAADIAQSGDGISRQSSLEAVSKPGVDFGVAVGAE